MIRNGHADSPARFVEFVTLMGLMMSLVALSIDAMLPALSQIGSDLGVTRANDNQLIVSLLLLGMAIGARDEAATNSRWTQQACKTGASRCLRPRDSSKRAGKP